MFADSVLQAVQKYTSHGDAEFLGHFFKTGEGQYGAGDIFIGVRAPDNRKVCKEFINASLAQLEELLESPIHELRLCAVMIMAYKYPKADAVQRKALFDLYLRRTDRINNWDIVDASCRSVVGQYILDHPEKSDILRKLARSKDLWERRIAIVSTWQLIRVRQFDLTYEIAEMLLNDKEDLIHKAVGWMLREAGKRDELPLREFLAEHKSVMPRTALRYAIEKFSPEDRAEYLRK
jgi:3-methyladenine DNA glycosylase AlkD